MRSPWLTLADALGDLEALLLQAGDGAFTAVGPDRSEGASRGVQRCLARFHALEAALPARGTRAVSRSAPIWTSGGLAAADATRQAIWRALALHDVAMATPLEVEVRVEAGAPPIVVPSSAGREVALLVDETRAVLAGWRTPAGAAAGRRQLALA